MTVVLVSLKAFATSANLPGKYPVYMSPPFLTISSTINVPRSCVSVLPLVIVLAIYISLSMTELTWHERDKAS